MPFTYETLNYLQRIGFNSPPPFPGGQFTIADIDLNSLVKIEGYGRMEKQPLRDPAKQLQLPSEDILNGLFSTGNNLAFIVKNDLDNVEIFGGCWKTKNSNVTQHAAVNENKSDIFKTLLDGSYPAAKINKSITPLFDINDYTMGGIVLGTPSTKSIDPLDGSSQMDRLIRSMSGQKWACLLLAQCINSSAINDIRKSVIEALRSVQNETEAIKISNPLAQYYQQMLSLALDNLTLGLMGGFWRTSVYLLGDDKSYFKLAGIWKSVFSGYQSLPEIINVITCREALDLACNFKLPDEPEKIGPDYYKHLLKYQTMLNSAQLAGYFHLPVLETGGFKIDLIPDFDAISPPTGKIVIPLDIGSIIYKTKKTENNYLIDINELNRHAFVSGITGAGKTNTIFILLAQALKNKIPFLVIEPAKTEYRALLHDETLSKELQIFTLGNELNSPFRINPFEIVSWPSTPISVHIDLLRSVFTSSFGMFTPLPQIFERCLIEIYKDKGWDIALNENRRLGVPPDLSYLGEAFPTMGDLALKAEDVIKDLGYEQKIADDFRAALLTRVNGLRTGGKGRMLDVKKSIPMELILDHPTILELEGLGDDDDKAFMMGLIFIKLIEFRKAQSQSSKLIHLLVFEEAHRLLTNVGSQSHEEANPRGKAVETFSNLLSEVRTYGQGIIVVDQVPSKLAPDVIKNTNLKIAHRCVEIEDRKILAGAMVMNEQQSQSLTTFDKGVAAVFSQGDDLPVLVKVSEIAHREWPRDSETRSHMQDISSQPYFKSAFDFSQQYDLNEKLDYGVYELVIKINDDQTFRKLFDQLYFVLIENDNDLVKEAWKNLHTYIRSFFGENVMNNEIERTILSVASKRLTDRKGYYAGWKFSDLINLNDHLIEVFLLIQANLEFNSSLTRLRQILFEMHERTFDPFIACSQICDKNKRVCLYRQHVKEYIRNSTENLMTSWKDAYMKDENDSLKLSWSICNHASNEIIGLKAESNESSKKIALCFAQHMLIGTKEITQMKIMKNYIENS
jgi:hypothetical protein